MSGLIVANAVDMVRAQFNFDVDRFPLYGPDNMPTGKYGLFRSHVPDGKCAFVGPGSVSERYNPHTTDDVVALVEAGSTLFNGDIDISCHFDDGHYVLIRPTKVVRTELYGSGSSRGGDTIWPQIMIRASYKRECVNAGVGMYRDMCKNMSIPHFTEGMNVAIRHTSGLRSKMDELIEQFSQLQNGWDNFLAVTRRMRDTESSIKDFLAEICGDRPEREGNTQTRYDNTIEKIVTRIMKEQAQIGQTPNGQASAWQLYNGVQGFVQHDKTRKGAGRSDGMARIIAANSDTMVKNAERYAMKLIA